MTQPNIIAILRGIAPSDIEAICGALIDAGISMIEVPLNSPNPFESIAQASKFFGDRITIGAGTVLGIDDVDAVAKAGGQFIVSPDCKPEVISHTKSIGLGSYPGVMTPSEAFRAIDAGADALKVFPAEVIGSAGIKAMKAVLPPELPVYAVGGVHPGNFKEFLTAGCAGFGLGSYLYVPGRSAADVHKSACLAMDEIGD